MYFPLGLGIFTFKFCAKHGKGDHLLYEAALQGHRKWIYTIYSKGDNLLSKAALQGHLIIFREEQNQEVVPCLALFDWWVQTHLLLTENITCQYLLHKTCL